MSYTQKTEIHGIVECDICTGDAKFHVIGRQNEPLFLCEYHLENFDEIYEDQLGE